MTSHRIFDHQPKDWEDLELMVAQAFTEMRYETHRNHSVSGIRGSVRVDVHAVKTTTPIPTVVLCECKHWNKAIDQSVVHAFRSVCSDVGAHFGLLISKVGFQSGAAETRDATNIHLLNFIEFQETFFEEWRSGVCMDLAQMMDWLLPLMPGNPYYADNAELQKKLNTVNVFDKYDVFFGDHRYTSYFVGGEGAFPITIIDPRGSPSDRDPITIKSYREFFDVSVHGCADARRHFGI